MKKNFMIGVAVTTLLLLGGSMYALSLGNKTSQMETSSQARAVVEQRTHDWGEIGIDDGTVEKVFEIRNEGSESLMLFNVLTSCMCTTAQLILGETVSPAFGMTRSGYSLEVPSGETAQLKVVYDPAFHGPSGVGPINRQVKLQTNDPANRELSFMVTAMVRR